MKSRSCWAVYTADQRINNPLTCQILVTVPEVLAYMLLTPSLARAWTPRIKRIILDEIHMLGSQKGGVWEHILMLCTAPIIGLSATVGEAEVFNDVSIFLFNSCYHLTLVLLVVESRTRIAWAPTLPYPA
jgi:superfamily II RNA helicase